MKSFKTFYTAAILVFMHNT